MLCLNLLSFLLIVLRMLDPLKYLELIISEHTVGFTASDMIISLSSNIDVTPKVATDSDLVNLSYNILIN